jgi:hypothetical protein
VPSESGGAVRAGGLGAVGGIAKENVPFANGGGAFVRPELGSSYSGTGQAQNRQKKWQPRKEVALRDAQGAQALSPALYVVCELTVELVDDAMA